MEQLAAQAALSAADCATLARETITHGQGVRQGGQPLLLGIVQDGLAAVDRGEGLDSKAADWPGLRAQLEEMLRPPPPQEQKQEEKKEEQKQEEKRPDQQENQSPDQQKQPEHEKAEQQKQSEQADQQPPPDKQSLPSSAQEPPPTDEQTQKVGGEKPEDRERQEHPELAVPLQKLDQVRDEDSPAELFELLHENEPKPPGAPKKDW